MSLPDLAGLRRDLSVVFPEQLSHFRIYEAQCRGPYSRWLRALVLLIQAPSASTLPLKPLLQ